MDIQELANQCLANSERWFPSNHTDLDRAINHCTLGLAGEAGETANKWKKFLGYVDQPASVSADLAEQIQEELVDTLIYTLVLMRLWEMDIPLAVQAKTAVCEERWGKK